jgi:UDP-N-acetylmuramate--alanine ligase
MHIYFIGIGGSGLSPLAQLALDCGYEVSGSDLQRGFGTLAVEKRGVLVNYHANPDYIRELNQTNPIDFIVYTAACKPDDPELLFAKSHNIKTGKRDSFINKITAEKKLKMLAVAGTHGKTTTTAMVVWLFKQFNLPISYLIGSNISFGPASQYQEGSEYFVYEADEFDRNFLHYNPFASVITNIDYDHPDTYPTKQEYYKAFSDFSLRCSHLFTWQDERLKLEASSHATFLPNEDTELNITLFGLHNRNNMRLALNLFHHVAGSLDDEDSLKVANLFPGTQRRFEKIEKNIYSDYAHHPTEISATLQLASEIAKNIVVVYQPHQNVRQHEIKSLYDHCFDLASKIYWLPTYLSRENENLEILSPSQLSLHVSQNKKILISELNDDLKLKIFKELSQPATIVVGMGAGSIDQWMRTNFINKDKSYE